MSHFVNQVWPCHQWRLESSDFPTFMLALRHSSTVQAHLIPVKEASGVLSRGSGNGDMFPRRCCPGVSAWFEFSLLLVWLPPTLLTPDPPSFSCGCLFLLGSCVEAKNWLGF